MSATYRPYILNLASVDQYIVLANDGSSNNCIGMRIDRGADKDLILSIRNASVLSIPGTSDRAHIAYAKHMAFMSWGETEVKSCQGGITKRIVPTVSMPENLTEFSIGSRNAGADPLWGWIENITIGKADATGIKSCRPTDIKIAGAGQSLMRGFFHSQASNGAQGHDALKQELNKLAPEKQTIFIDGTTGGSSASRSSDGNNYWWDENLSCQGPALANFYEQVEESEIIPDIILWSQGEADCHFIGGPTSKNVYKNCLLQIFEDIRSRFGDVHIFIQPIGRRSASSSYANEQNAGIQTIREVQKELVLENPQWCFMAGETYDLPLHDEVHLTDNGYAEAAKRHARIIASPQELSGPEILSAVRDGAEIHIKIRHHNGNDFSPAENISGFKFKAGEKHICITSITKTDHHNIVMTLAEMPTQGLEVLYYGYDAMTDLDPDKVLKDNSPLSMPLKTQKLIL